MIVSEQFPQIDHRFNFIRSNVPAAYGEDRTIGSTPIQQQLPNLSDAGLLYSQLIYSKSPVVMEMLFVKLGPDKSKRESVNICVNSATGMPPGTI